MTSSCEIAGWEVGAERERERLQSLPNLKERFETVITGLTTTRKRQHIDEAREALRTRL